MLLRGEKVGLPYKRSFYSKSRVEIEKITPVRLLGISTLFQVLLHTSDPYVHYVFTYGLHKM